jgi:sulfite exporter TauE/SafE
VTPLAAVATGLVFALANAVHCAGMCGAFAMRAAASPRPCPGFLLYGAGKTFTYLFFGALAGALGARVLAEGTPAQVALGMAAGALLFVAGVRRLLPGAARAAGGGALAAFLQPALAAAGRTDAAWGRFVLGAVTAALPCGVVYLAALQAAAAGTAEGGLLLMAGFGAGTLPSLGVAAALGHRVLSRLPRPALRFAGGSLLVALGILAVVRAAGPLFRDGTPGSCCH